MVEYYKGYNTRIFSVCANAIENEVWFIPFDKYELCLNRDSRKALTIYAKNQSAILKQIYNNYYSVHQIKVKQGVINDVNGNQKHISKSIKQIRSNDTHVSRNLNNTNKHLYSGNNDYNIGIEFKFNKTMVNLEKLKEIQKKHELSRMQRHLKLRSAELYQRTQTVNENNNNRKGNLISINIDNAKVHKKRLRKQPPLTDRLKTITSALDYLKMKNLNIDNYNDKNTLITQLEPRFNKLKRYSSNNDIGNNKKVQSLYVLNNKQWLNHLYTENNDLKQKSWKKIKAQCVFGVPAFETLQLPPQEQDLQTRFFSPAKTMRHFKQRSNIFN
jgi:hypothetical protein